MITIGNTDSCIHKNQYSQFIIDEMSVIVAIYSCIIKLYFHAIKTYCVVSEIAKNMQGYLIRICMHALIIEILDSKSILLQ